MGNSPVTLDFSKAQPIAQAAPVSQAQPVTLDFSKAQSINQGSDFQQEAEEAKEAVEHGESPAAAYMKPGQTATALNAMLTVGGAAGGVAAGLEAIGSKAVPAAKMVATGLVDELGNPIMREQAAEKVGKIPGILKASYDWAKANPVKAYLLYKVADEIGLGPKSLKQLFHLASGSGAE